MYENNSTLTRTKKSGLSKWAIGAATVLGIAILTPVVVWIFGHALAVLLCGFVVLVLLKLVKDVIA